MWLRQAGSSRESSALLSRHSDHRLRRQAWRGTTLTATEPAMATKCFMSRLHVNYVAEYVLYVA